MPTSRQDENSGTSRAGATALGTGFTFQGGLSTAAGPVTGTCDLRFNLFSAANGGGQVGPTLTRTNVQLTNGLFAVDLDFGNVFTGDPRWLEVSVRCPAGIGVYTILAPRQPVSPTPYALTASQAFAAPGRFIAYGDIWSSVNPHDGVAGALVLENPATGNRWMLPIRHDNNDRLDFDFWDAGTNTWYNGASLERNGNFSVPGAVIAQSVYARGELWSARSSDGVNAGMLNLENATSGNRWSIPIRPETGDRLEFHFWNSSNQTWHRVASLDGQKGFLVVDTPIQTNLTLLQLRHPKAQWHFLVDGQGHPEISVYDSIATSYRWNVLDIDQTTGNVGLGTDATPTERLRVEGNLTAAGLMSVSTLNPNNVTLFRLIHPKTQVYFHVDPTGHPEIGIYSAAIGQTHWDTLDFDADTGHVGVGGMASVAETLKVYGNFSATGTKSAMVETESYGARKLYAVEAADVRFSDEGLAQLQAGTARINLDPIFVETIEEPYIITVTPYGNASLYVAEIGKSYFVIKTRDGDDQVRFAWRLSARRKGYGHIRLESVAATGPGQMETQP